MMLTAIKGLFVLVLVGAAWVAGSIYPAPARITALVPREWVAAHARPIDLSPQALTKLKAALSPAQFVKMSQDAAQLAAKTGQALIVEHVSAQVTQEAQAVETYEPQPVEQGSKAKTPAQPQLQLASASSTVGGFEDTLSLCPKMKITDAPAADAHGLIVHYNKIINVNGVRLATDPTHHTCFSSGFGERGGRLHKGIDLYSADGSPILAAGDGTVIEKKYRDDYGNMLLIDHGHGVYTRYCHLASFGPVEIGSHVSAGQQLGLMGNTAAYRVPIHLHYELLTGDYNNPKGSFGLTPHSPFEYGAG